MTESPWPDPASATESGGGVPSQSASPPTRSPSPMSPSDMPTIGRPSAPPSAPSDLVPRGVVAGRITALADACTDVTTDEGVTWSLVGAPEIDLSVGDTVIARAAELGEGDAACGEGRGARLVSIRLVGG